MMMSPESALVSPALSTVSQQGVEKGKQAGEMLCSIMYNQRYEPHLVLEPRLVIRESTGPCSAVKTG
jgi:DNA-binding LacI/PurR family transcriptional regulator